jgi:PAS domain S-box-containing protein
MTRARRDLELDGERFRALSLSAFDMLSEVDRRGHVTYVSPNHARLHDRKPEELVDLLSLEAVLSEDRPLVQEQFRKLFERGEGARATFRTRDPQGRIRWIECTGTPVTTPEGETRALLLSREVTEQKETEARLEASRERFQSIAENAYDMIVEHDEHGNVLFANDETLRNLGLQAGGSWTRDPLSMVVPEDLPQVEQAVSMLESGQTPPTTRYRVVHADGSLRFIEARFRRYVTQSGETRIHTIARDVTERVVSERRIQESEARHRELVEKSPLGIVVVQGGRICFSNTAGASAFGAETPDALVGRPIIELLHPEDAVAIPKLVARAQQGEKMADLAEARLRGLDGVIREVIATGSIIDYEGAPAYQGIVRDVTGLRSADRERRRLELQLQEARKLESLGVLAGGIAHDFNNLLAVILANTRYAQRDAGSEESAEALADAIEAGEQAARLTRQLLAYAGRRSPDVRSTDISVLARSTTDLLTSALPRGVTLETRLDPALPRVRADVVQLEQVLMNLVINAGDAMAETPGSVCISTGHTSVSSDQIAGWAIGGELLPGEYVYLEVRDSGCGMDEDTLARVFEPFFSTKRGGHGLGLAAVLGMVRGHHGGVELASQPGHGTRFRVYLPAEPRPLGDGGAMIVLAVEGETAEALGDAMARRGLAALAARDLDAVCDLLRRHGDEVVAVACGAAACDDALSTVRRLRTVQPALPVLWIGTAPPSVLATLQSEGPAESVGGSDAAGRIADGLEALLGKV